MPLICSGVCLETAGFIALICSGQVATHFLSGEDFAEGHLVNQPISSIALLQISTAMDTGHCCFLWCNKTTRKQNNISLPPYSQRLSHVIAAGSNLAIRRFSTKGDFLQLCEGLLPPLLGFPRVENELKATFDQRWNY